MPIAKRFIEAYLARRVPTLSWLKQLTPLEVEEELSYINPKPKFTAPLRIDQKICFIAGLAYPEILYMTDLGLGKGHPVGTKILTPTGYRPIESLILGDKVIGSQGKPVNITGVFKRGILPTFRVSFSDGSSISTDGDHLWNVHKYRDKAKNRYKIMTTSQLKTSLETGWRYWSIPMVKPVEFSSKLLPIPPYVLGVLLGDGHLTRKNSVGFTPGDLHVPNEVEKELPKGLFLTKYKGSGTRAITWRIRSKGQGPYRKNSILDGLRNLGLVGIKSQNRFIPDEYLKSCIDDRIALLQGLLDTDGCLTISKKSNSQHLEFNSSSKQLAEGVKFLIESLGGTARYRIRKNVRYTYKSVVKEGLPCHRVTINLPVSITPLRAFAFKWKARQKYTPNRKVVSVIEEGNHKVICLAVDAKDKLYVTENCIVTHNTAVSLELLSYFYSNGFIRRAFVFCPTDELVEGWEDELRKWKYTIPYCLLRKGSSKKKWETFNNFSEDGLIIGTYVGIAAMAASIKPVLNKRTGKTKNKRVTDRKILQKLLRNVDAVVYDQSTAIGNSNSLSYKTCRYFSEHAQIRFSLAGRAFGRDPILLWAQFYLTDGGKAFGSNSWMFREAFYRRKQFKFGDKWILRKRREKIMSRLIKASSIRYSVNECISLPPKVYIKKYCEFPEENWTYFEQVKTELLFHAKKRDWREVRNTLLKARQMSSGFVGFIDDASGDRAEIEFLHNPKLDLLSAIIDEVPDNKKCIIFHEFNWSGQRICDLLTKKKLQFGRLWGGTKDWTSIKDAFNNQQDYRFLVANSKKSSMGLNLQVASYAVYYESPIGAIIRAESEGRIHRSGQQHKTFIYDLIVKGSYDELILDFHRAGSDLWKALVENTQQVLKKAA